MCVTSEKVALRIGTPYGEREIQHAVAVDRLDLPVQALTEETAKMISESTLTPISSYSETRPRILIGQDNWPLIVTRELRKIDSSGLVVSRTELGWTAHSFTTENAGKEQSCANIFSMEQTREETAQPNDADKGSMNSSDNTS